uniref:NADH dehydrogenase subunit 2 n=1 Tax=Aporrectodea trapezoides TaxID=408844 RepID=UPI0021CCB79D|nr:NADH dehydrogenase subunit 2 [Aporrectodea trapezoides]UWM94566.1 NADH dehydrogenase subunit 2 [Aporrectodea trapezoides]
MSFIHSPTMMLTLISLLMSTLMTLSSTNWILLWGAMELNLLSFIPIMMQTKNNQETEGAVKYFLAQALGSALLLMSSTSLWMMFTSLPNIMPLMLTTAILLKLGSVPCHFWYPSVMSSISWISCLILSTWQKLAPLSIMAFLLPQKNMSFIMAVAGINALVGGIMGMNQSQMRTIMAYSSIGHIGWMLSLLAMFKPNASILYFMVYSILITPLFSSLSYFNIFSTKQMNKIPSNSVLLHLSTIILFLSLGGLPPLTGFMPKLMTIMILTDTMKIIMFMLVAGSVMNLFFYLNIVISMMFTAPNLKLLSPVKAKVTSVLVLTTASLSLGLSPLIMM